MEIKVTDWITLGAALISAIGIGLLWIQTNHLRRQINFDHERARRENAINLILKWTENLQPGMTAARKLIENLNEQQTRSIYRRNP